MRSSKLQILKPKIIFFSLFVAPLKADIIGEQPLAPFVDEISSFVFFFATEGEERPDGGIAYSWILIFNNSQLLKFFLKVVNVVKLSKTVRMFKSCQNCQNCPKN